MDLLVTADGIARFGAIACRCALGRGGIRLEKHEGDGATPIGAWPLRAVLFRADRLAWPATGLSAHAIEPQAGWCDAPGDPAYNRPVRLPYTASAEHLWRADAVYDVIVVLGYNDDPVVPGAGSAIFLHVAHPDFSPTEGCVALAAKDLLDYLRSAGPGDRVIVAA